MDHWMWTSISRSKKSGVREFNPVLFWPNQAMLCRDRLFRLCKHRRTITNRGWWPATPSGLLFKKNGTRRVPLQDIWQRTSRHNSMFRKIKARAGRHRPTSESAHWPQRVRVFYDHQEVNTAASKVGGIPIGVQLYNQLLEWQKKQQSRRTYEKAKRATYRRWEWVTQAQCMHATATKLDRPWGWIATHWRRPCQSNRFWH